MAVKKFMQIAVETTLATTPSIIVIRKWIESNRWVYGSRKSNIVNYARWLVHWFDGWWTQPAFNPRKLCRWICRPHFTNFAFSNDSTFKRTRFARSNVFESMHMFNQRVNLALKFLTRRQCETKHNCRYRQSILRERWNANEQKALVTEMNGQTN